MKLRIKTLKELLLELTGERKECNERGLLLGRLKRLSSSTRFCCFSDGSTENGLPCLLLKGEDFGEELDVLRPPRDLLIVSHWRLVCMCDFSREARNQSYKSWMLVITKSSIKLAKALKAWYSYYIPNSMFEQLPKWSASTSDSKALFTFQRNSFIPGPHKNILASTTVKIIAKSILISGKTSKGFMLQVECHYPSKMDIDVSFQFIAYILFTQEASKMGELFLLYTLQ
jgi:hypothetical protein